MVLCQGVLCCIPPLFSDRRILSDGGKGAAAATAAAAAAGAAAVCVCLKFFKPPSSHGPRRREGNSPDLGGGTVWH